jgi:hypothetical protein
LVGYLRFVAHRYPKHFCHLLNKLMPLQLNGSVALGIGPVNIVAVPAGTFLTPEQIAAHYPQSLPPPRSTSVPRRTKRKGPPHDHHRHGRD